MASILKVDKLDPQSGTALEIGTSGDTISVPSGATLDISSATLTPPATLPASSGVNLTALNATNLGSGTVPTARLGTGTASSSTVLYGDQTYKAEPTGGLVYVGGLVSTSATAYYQVDNVFTATYSRYLVTFRVIPVTTGAGIDLQFRTSAPATLSAAEYEYSLHGFDSDNNSTFRDGQGTTQVQLTHGVNNDAARGGMTGVMYFSEIDSGDRSVVTANYMYPNDSAVMRTMIGSITYKATSDAIAGFQFYGSGGTADDDIDSGSIRVYGIVDS